MNDFDWDVVQKKRISSGAAHRKRGAKSKKCTLPHDNLTQKELRALSGEVKTYNIHQRMSWARFKALPDDVAAKHIDYLVETFGANIGAIAASLGACYDSVFKYLKAHNIKLKKRVFVETPEWLAFIGEAVETAPVESEPAEEEVVETKPHEHPVQFLRGNLVLTGAKGAVTQRLFEVLPNNVTVNVEFTAEEA